MIRPCLIKEGYDSTGNFPACCTDVECIFEIIFTIQISFLDALAWFNETRNLNFNLKGLDSSRQVNILRKTTKLFLSKHVL